MATKRKTPGKKRTASKSGSCTVSNDFYKTMRGCKNGVRKGSYGKLNYRSVKVE